MDSCFPSSPSFDLDGLDSFEMLSAETEESQSHENRQLLHHDPESSTTNNPHQHQSSPKPDPLDALFSSPVRELLAREDTPDRSVASSSSSGLFANKRRCVFGADGRDDSLQIVARHLLNEEENEDEYNNPNLKLFAGLKDDFDCEDVPDLMDPEEPPLGCHEGIVPSFPPPSSFSPSPQTVPSALPTPSLARSQPGRLRAATPAVTPEAPTSDPRAKKPRRGQVGSRPPSSREITNPTSSDVLFGKGGLINKWPGNLAYHAQKKQLQIEYLEPDTPKQTKRDLVLKLYHIVVHEWGGRFLRRADETSPAQDTVWLEAHKEAALEKCRQALATPERSREERAARRRMFIEKRKRRQTSYK